MTCYLQPETPGKLVPLCKQDLQLLLLHSHQKVQASRLGFCRSNTTELSYLKAMEEVEVGILATHRLGSSNPSGQQSH
jgi:hypothetical protein